ncbi:hypothetical protein ACVWZD_000408 [Streptomyces sp. TE3672]
MTSSNLSNCVPSRHTTMLSTQTVGRRRCGAYAGVVLTACRPAGRGPIPTGGGAQ